MKSFEKSLITKIQGELVDCTPGLQLQVHHRGRKLIDLEAGESFPYYDLASVTKIIFTTQSLMWAYDQELWNLKTKVSEILPWFPHLEMKITDCLDHSSGMLWWGPFFEKLELLEKDPLVRLTELQRMIRDEVPCEKTDVSIYSDVNFMILGFVLESLFEKPLLSVWEMTKEIFYPQSDFEIHAGNIPKHKISLYAPTEFGGWRQKKIQGEVNDDNCWSLGGVSAHAGVFGSIDDLGWYALHLRALIQGGGAKRLKSKTIQLFTRRARPVGQGDFALGFMLPSKTNSLVGDRLSRISIGHWGFTGCSVWYDPENDLSVSLCSNRTFLGRENKKFNLLRPRLHDWILEGIKK